MGETVDMSNSIKCIARMCIDSIIINMIVSYKIYGITLHMLFAMIVGSLAVISISTCMIIPGMIIGGMIYKYYIDKTMTEAMAGTIVLRKVILPMIDIANAITGTVALSCVISLLF